MPASTSRRAGPIGPIELATITSFFVGRMPAGTCRTFRRFPVLILRAQPRTFRLTVSRSDPRPGVTPGVAEGTKEGGRSCPLRGLSPTAGRARNAANARANVVEVQTFQ